MADYRRGRGLRGGEVGGGTGRCGSEMAVTEQFRKKMRAWARAAVGRRAGNSNCDTFRRWKHPGLDWMQGEEGKEEAKNAGEGLRKESDFQVGYAV